mgnify:FL=1
MFGFGVVGSLMNHDNENEDDYQATFLLKEEIEWSLTGQMGGGYIFGATFSAYFGDFMISSLEIPSTQYILY